MIKTTGHERLFIRRGLTDWRDSLFVAQTGEPDSSDKSNMTEWGHALAEFCSSLHKLLCVCIGRGRQRRSPLQHRLLKKKQKKKKDDETFHPIYSNAARHRKALTLSCRCLQDLEVGVECGGVCLHDCLQNRSRCTFSLLAYSSTSVSVCVWVLSQVLVFYLHVNRTCPERMSTRNISNPALKNDQCVFVSSSDCFFSSYPLFLTPSRRSATIFSCRPNWYWQQHKSDVVQTQADPKLSALLRNLY